MLNLTESSTGCVMRPLQSSGHANPLEADDWPVGGLCERHSMLFPQIQPSIHILRHTSFALLTESNTVWKFLLPTEISKSVKITESQLLVPFLWITNACAPGTTYPRDVVISLPIQFNRLNHRYWVTTKAKKAGSHDTGAEYNPRCWVMTRPASVSWLLLLVR